MSWLIDNFKKFDLKVAIIRGMITTNNKELYEKMK